MQGLQAPLATQTHSSLGNAWSCCHPGHLGLYACDVPRSHVSLKASKHDQWCMLSGLHLPQVGRRRGFPKQSPCPELWVLVYGRGHLEEPFKEVNLLTCSSLAGQLGMDGCGWVGRETCSESFFSVLIVFKLLPLCLPLVTCSCGHLPC